MIPQTPTSSLDIFIESEKNRGVWFRYLIKGDQFRDLKSERSIEHLHHEIHSGPTSGVGAIIINARTNAFWQRPNSPTIQIPQNRHERVVPNIEFLRQILQLEPRLLLLPRPRQHGLEKHAPRRKNAPVHRHLPASGDHDPGVCEEVKLGGLEHRLEILREAPERRDVRRRNLRGKGFGGGGDAADAATATEVVGIGESSSVVHRAERQKGVLVRDGGS